MQLEDYFDFNSPDEIKLKGHRIWVEDVLYEHIFREMQPLDLAKRFPTLTLEEIYACLLYYQHNKERMDQYLADYLEFCRRNREEQEKNPSPAVLHLRAIRAEYQIRRKAEMMT